MCVFCVALEVSELVEEVACLSDSTSEDRSLNSFTSESFDDNGKTSMSNHPKAPLHLFTTYCKSTRTNESQADAQVFSTKIMLCLSPRYLKAIDLSLV